MSAVRKAARSGIDTTSADAPRADTLLRAVQTPRRREILRLVWDAERSAGEIHRAFGDVTFGAVSQHLRVLAQAGLVAQRVEGRNRYYLAKKRELGSLRTWLEAQWDSALSRLAIEAELEAARRGPRSKSRTRRKTKRRSPSPTSPDPKAVR